MTNDEIFQQVASTFTHDEQHGSSCVLEAIKSFFDTELIDCAYSLLCHSIDVQSPDDSFDFTNKTWTQIYLESYRRAFFDLELSEKYGTGHVARNPFMLRMVSDALSVEGSFFEPEGETAEVSDLPSNVIVLPTPKTRQ